MIFLYTTNQHKKYDIFHVEYFSQNSKLILDRAHRALVNKSEANAASENSPRSPRS